MNFSREIKLYSIPKCKVVVYVVLSVIKQSKEIILPLPLLTPPTFPAYHNLI